MIRLTTLGTGTVALVPHRTCAGHLVEAGGTRLLLDCGPGILRRLAEQRVEWRTLTHIALTHFHIDHHGDIPTLLFAWKYGMLPGRSAPIDIIGPSGTASLFERLASAYGDWVTAPGYPLVIHELSPDGVMEIGGGVTLRWTPVPHTPESVAYCIEHGGRRLVYTGDTGVSSELAAWARDCDLLLAECSLPQSMAIPEHLTPEQCGELATQSHTRHLVLTHFYPPVEQVDIPAAVRHAYTGPLTVAHDGWSIELEDE
jgi:ribonuclease BN (tRNA processing enzyme)